MPKALIITPFYKSALGGAESFAEDLAKELSKTYLVHISTIKWDKPVAWEGLNYLKAVKLLLKLSLGTRKMLKKNRYEKIYALGMLSSLVCVFLGLKFSAIILALYDFKKPNLYGWILNRAEKVFVEGENGKLDIVIAGVKPDKIIPFQHWCNQTQFTYLAKNNPRLKVLFVGRPIKIKGEHIIRDCQILTSGIDYEYISNVSHKDMPRHYQMADVVVVPSLYSEGFSKVVVEGASCGCAIITSDKGSLPEMVRYFGKAIDPIPENFARELNALKLNRTALERLQLNTALYALNHFSSKNAQVFL